MKSLNCPSCPAGGAALVIVERQGIEIDYCPTCRGVWLDRGELDKIVERSLGARGYNRDDDDDDNGEYHHRPAPRSERGERTDHYPPKKRESFLSRMFDFD